MNIMKSFSKSLRKGYVALMSVILMGALGTAVMVSVISQGVTSSKTELSLQQLGQARVLATACAEEALQVILETSTTSKTDVLVLGSGSCSYTISKPSSFVIINATGNYGSLVKRVQVTLSTSSPSIVLSSWQDVSDF